MNKDKNIIHSIKINEVKPNLKQIENRFLFEITDKIAFENVNKVDNAIIEHLYKTYKELTYINTLYVIDKEEFKKFLLKYLPIYLEERENDK